MPITVCDVAPRDGLQNEPDVLSVSVRADLVNRLAAAGMPRVEAASFVRDDRVPQMAGAEEVVAAIEPRDGTGTGMGLYFGATSGDVFGSGDAGGTWFTAATRLPPVNSVRVA